MKENLITWKIEYSCEESLLPIIKQYNSLLRYTYNRLSERKLTFSEVNSLQKSINNCDKMNSWLRTSAEYEAKAMLKRDDSKAAIFGGRKLFVDRCQHKISKEEFQLKRLMPLYSIGEASQKGNRMIHLLDAETVVFRLNKHIYTLKLGAVGRNRLKHFETLIQLQNNKQAAITYKIDLDYVYITFDYNLLKQFSYQVKANRVFAVDLNPNSIGWSVVDWLDESKYNVVQSGTFSLKPLNDYRNAHRVSSSDPLHEYVTNKRNHEIIEISKQLFNLCKHYKCEVFALEQLSIPAKDNHLGKRYNRLVNNMWNRNLLINQIRKRINASSTELVEVQPEWNSYIGNLIFRQEALPDECLASIEIGRRGWEFSTQYIFKRRPKRKVVIYPDLELVKNQLSISLEEIGIDVPNLDEWKDILQAVKKSKSKYRFSSEAARKQHAERLFSKLYKERYLLIYEYL